MNPDPSLLRTVRRTLHSGSSASESVLAALHAEAEASANLRRRQVLRMRFLRIAAAAVVVLGTGICLRAWRTRPVDPELSPVESALEMLLLEEYGDSFEEGLASADKLLLYQEYPGNL